MIRTYILLTHINRVFRSCDVRQTFCRAVLPQVTAQDTYTEPVQYVVLPETFSQSHTVYEGMQ